MRYWIILLAASLFSAWPPAYGPYRNKNRWYLTEGLERQPLHGHPRKITRRIYGAPDSAHPLKKSHWYFEYGFNADGDLVYRHDYEGDILIENDNLKYDADGSQVRGTRRGGSPNVPYVTSRRLPDGRFKEFLNGTAYIVSYSPNGGEVTEEDYPDTSAQGKPYQTVQTLYDNEKKIRQTTISDTTFEQRRYFYSRWDSPDSIHVYTGSPADPNLTEREIFYNNEHGDPIRKIKLSESDTLTEKEYRYVYDNRGNWIRKTEVYKKNMVSPAASKVIYVTVQDIEY